MGARPTATGTRPVAVVVGQDCITGLQTARILAGRGAPVIGIASDRSHFACRTRACTRVLEVEPGSPQLIDTLAALAARLDSPPVLFPCTDRAVLCLSRNDERVRRFCRLALPPRDVVELLVDKARFASFATDHGLSVPRTKVLRDGEDAADAAASLAFPCVLKPSVKTARWDAHTKVKAFRVRDADHLIQLYERCRGWADVLVAQEWIDGPDRELYSFNGYFDESSRPLVTFIARKLRQWPPHTGTSSLGEECRNDVVLDEALRLFQLVGHQGLAYLEMKRDVRTGRHYVVEPNIGRATGRSAIAEAGGVELLWTKYCHLAGEPLPEARVQRYASAKWIYWRQDVRSAWYHWRRGSLAPADWLRSWRGVKRCAVFSWNDPLPFFFDCLGVAARHWRRPLAVGGKPEASVEDAGAADGAWSDGAVVPISRL